MKPSPKIFKWSLGKTLWDVGMQYGVWRRDIQLYTGFFPVEVMARQWMAESSFPEHSEVHDFLVESCEPQPKKWNRIKEQIETTPAKPKVKPMRRTNGYSPRYYEKVMASTTPPNPQPLFDSEA